jgi:hypothetical protein
VYLSATNGYQVSPASPADLGDVAAGASAAQKWTVTPPADATSGSRLTAVAVFATGGTAESVQATGAVTPPAPSLQAAYDNAGISDDASPTAADVDGAGSSFSAQALAAAGATPGGTVTAGGANFTWPNVAAGQNDNAVASGTAFGMSGSGGTLSFLLTSAYGPSTGTGQVIYSDGTSDSFTLTVPDWHSGCSSSGTGVALYMPYRNRPNGKDSLPVCVFDASTPLQSVTRIVLPNVSGSVTSGVPSLRIFAATIH